MNAITLSGMKKRTFLFFDPTDQPRDQRAPLAASGHLQRTHRRRTKRNAIAATGAQLGDDPRTSALNFDRSRRRTAVRASTAFASTKGETSHGAQQHDLIRILSPCRRRRNWRTAATIEEPAKDRAPRELAGTVAFIVGVLTHRSCGRHPSLCGALYARARPRVQSN